jgi:hypothetical protein
VHSALDRSALSAEAQETLLNHPYAHAPQSRERLVMYCQTTSVSAAHSNALCCLLYPVSAALTSIFRIDSKCTSYRSQEVAAGKEEGITGRELERFPKL